MRSTERITWGNHLSEITDFCKMGLSATEMCVRLKYSKDKESSLYRFIKVSTRLFEDWDILRKMTANRYLNHTIPTKRTVEKIIGVETINYKSRGGGLNLRTDIDGVLSYLRANGADVTVHDDTFVVDGQCFDKLCMFIAHVNVNRAQRGFCAIRLA